MHGRKNMFLSIAGLGLIVATCAVIAQDTPRDLSNSIFKRMLPAIAISSGRRLRPRRESNLSITASSNSGPARSSPTDFTDLRTTNTGGYAGLSGWTSTPRLPQPFLPWTTQM